LGGRIRTAIKVRAQAAACDDVLVVDMPAAAQAHRVYDHYLAGVSYPC